MHSLDACIVQILLSNGANPNVESKVKKKISVL